MSNTVDRSIYQTPLVQQAVLLANDATYLMMANSMLSGRTTKEAVAVVVIAAQLLLDACKAAAADMNIDISDITGGN